ncbi:hypothetical protein ABIB62_003022 [Mucilaginibacter sp. UYP25]|uniref:hypothetical protein n=1 Tax=unclassified Mucilaginibacter TaxID=2617802 RepID=UPI003391B707
MKFILLISLSLVSHAQSYSQIRTVTTSRLMGSTYKYVNELPPFKGYKEQIGTMLLPTEDNYAVSVVAKGQYNVLILDTCLKEGASVKYKILDTAIIGMIPRNQTIVTSDCRLRQKNDSYIIAIVKPDDKKYYKNVVRAWRFDRPSRKLRRMRVEHIDCLSEGYNL